jgi:hypothetical protein
MKAGFFVLCQIIMKGTLSAVIIVAAILFMGKVSNAWGADGRRTEVLKLKETQLLSFSIMKHWNACLTIK